MGTVAPLVWVPWVPGNPQNFKQWVPEPTNFETKKYVDFVLFSIFIVFVEVADESVALIE